MPYRPGFDYQGSSRDLVLARIGQSRSLSGQPLPVVTLEVPTQNSLTHAEFIQCQSQHTGRQRFHGVECHWVDGETHWLSVK